MKRIQLQDLQDTCSVLRYLLAPFGCPLALLLIAILLASPAWASQVSVPVRLDLAFVRQALVQQIYTEPGEKAAIFDDGVGCGWLDLYEPKVDVAEASLHITSRGDARLGTKIGSQCLVALEWKGFVEVFEEPQLDGATRVLKFKIIDSNIYDEEHKKRFTTGKLWDLVKTSVHPRFENMRLDLNQPFNELRAWLPLVLPGSAERIERMVNSLSVRDPRVVEGGLAVTLAFEAEPRPAAAAATPEPTLSPAEVGAWQAKWQQWDAFVTFMVKHFARDNSGELGHALFELLLDARHELLEALAPPYSGAPDPVPGFFLRTWERLAPVLRQAAAGLPAETALQYTSFITAGDALAALHELGPDLGVELSADGLRRLARMIAPAASADPVAYSIEIDPELRTLLGFGAPLPPPEIATDVEIDLSALAPLLRWFVAPAGAAIAPDTIAKLNRWAPTRDDVASYLPLVRDLLVHAGNETLAANELGVQFQPLYRHLVFAAAWQESCWRQFVRQGGKLTPIKSAVGSVGMMQVNQNVWRGVYDLKGLLGDIAYNGRAGSEILLHYLRDYAIAKGEQNQPGGSDNLARATYAIYNGGPGHRTRYRANKPKPALKKIDDLFWAKYAAVRDGRELEVARCYGE
ncbi:MAG: lytic transglycosylase domain-containing protein [Deltaproteobacteria bacterium]|nr:lytic transglycosylase domain-containing protein [Deltaproteobacteria bacterium]